MSVEYVKVCPTYGPGYFYIPGSETCLKIGGNAHFEGMYLQPYTKAQDSMGTRAQGQITFDARTASEYGLLRSFVSLGLVKRNGLEQSGSQQREGNATTNTNAISTAKQTFFNYQAYVQLGGFTVGRMASFAQSQFGFNDFIGSPGVDARDFVTTVAYTASLGNGVSLTAALEDGTEASRMGVYAASGSGAAATALGTLSSVTGGSGLSNYNTIGAINYGGSRIPDAVIALNVDQAWGSAHLAASSHMINYGKELNGSTAGIASTVYGNTMSTDIGYSVQGGLKVNLPMIAAGDSIAIQSVYAKGYNAAVWRNWVGDLNSNDSGGAASYNPGWNAVGTLNDVVVDVSNHKSYMATSYGGAGEFTHYFTPTVAAFVGGGYAKIDWAAGAQAAGGAAKVNPLSTWNAYVGAIWTPVKGFKVVPMVEYDKVTAKTAFAASGAEPLAKSIDTWQGRVRITRDF